MRLSDRLRDPIIWTNIVQLLKTVVAAVIAWSLAVHLFHIDQAFLAPWAALLTVHATVYRTLRRGVQQVGATVLGVLVAVAAESVLGVSALSLGIVVLVGLVAGSVRGLRAETTTAAATALVVLTTGYGDDSPVLVARLLDTAIGIGVGLLVNLLVWPPLHDRAAARQVDVIDDRLGELLCDVAEAIRGGYSPEDVDDWLSRTAELDHEIEKAWGVVHQAHESGRWNPRSVAPERMRAAEGFGAVLERLEQAVAETRSMTLTLRRVHLRSEEWEPAFLARWLELLHSAGAAIGAADVQGVETARQELGAFAAELPVDELPEGSWPVYGALLVNLRNILAAVDVVVGAQPVEVAPPALGGRS